MTESEVRAGVVGAGSMGENHARVYEKLSSTSLVGVHDVRRDRAETVASTYGAEACEFADLLEIADVVSVAVPTEYHYETVRECIDAGVDVLVEKPFVENPDRGRKLVEFADDRGVTLQVGHIERFNPAVRKLLELVPELEVIAVDARRLGPAPDRQIDDSAVMDLMIHDLDVILQILDEPAELTGAGTADGDYATATVQTEAGRTGTLTASRVTQEKVRKLTVTAADCRVKLDYIDQSIEICRRSFPEYVRQEGSVHYRHENVVEKLVVERREPLKNEIEAFVSAATGEGPAEVTGTDGVRAVEFARRIDDLISTPAPARAPVSSRQ